MCVTVTSPPQEKEEIDTSLEHIHTEHSRAGRGSEADEARGCPVASGLGRPMAGQQQNYTYKHHYKR